MAGDQTAGLILQAHSEGLIDFTKYNPFDRRWLTNLGYTLKSLEKRNYIDLLKLRHEQCLVMLELVENNKKQDQWQKIVDVYDNIMALLMPWYKDVTEKDRKKKFSSLEEQYKSAYGYENQNDPEISKRIKETVEFLNKGTKRTVKTTDVNEKKRGRGKRNVSNR